MSLPASRDARLGTIFNQSLLDYAAASAAAQFGDKCMPKFNWRSLDDTYYDHIEQAEMTGLAWECLRRNASFERDYQTISSSDRTLSGRIRQHWGLVFRS